MKKILQIQALIFLSLTILSYILQGTPWLPIMFLLSTVAGPYMAYTYPWDMQTHVIITLGFLLAIVMMWFGIKYRTMVRGIIIFLLGFWLWTFIGLVFGLGTGT